MATISSSLLLGLSGLLATYVFLHFLLMLTQNPQEPRALATGIPFLSPIIGMRKKGKFYTELRNKFNLPVYTLRIPFMRLYIINSTELIPAVQRQIRILDFAPLEAKAAMNVMGASPEGRKILVRDVEGVGGFGYPILFDKAIHPAVTPGPMLDAMNRLSVLKVAETVELLAAQAPKTLKLFDWIKKEITHATTEAVYGPKNPFRDAKVREDYYKFEPGIITLLLNIFPTLFAKESVQARKDIVDSFHNYFTSRGHEEGSGFVKAHYQHKIDQGLTGRDIASFEIGGIVAIMSNTIPAAFWLLYHTITDAAILAECRKEVIDCCKISEDTCTLDIAQVKASCPVLLSILKETLRFHGIGTSVRIVMQDHLLDGKYLLKKGGVVMIPGVVQHTSIPAYGETVGEFQHKRFVRSPGRKRPNPVAFRGFGGGSTLCPGRNFASTEVLAFVALAIVRFDFEPTKGEWVFPTTYNANMAGTIAQPDHDVEVRVSLATSKLADKKWNVVLSGSDEGIQLSAEDIR
ncbi:cytochrome P450 [Amniculicola lignicola CBS 123094]|uniref:Cytochrome P450 n=1 Tax=Amniculicola lignicola CBS 123094 TaxID=1392246 RepID=A0A6A5W5U8_9PLEO|nr:cytochrome P450 [Amniculicola lignicola CBS 123094]